MLELVAVMFGVSLDAAVYMMRVGATVRSLTWKKRLSYSLIYTGVTFLAVVLAYGIALLLDDTPFAGMKFLCAGIIILCMGIILVMKGFQRHTFEEKLDRTFSAKRMLKIAVITNLDMVVSCMSFAFIGISFPLMAVTACAMSFVITFAFLSVGYTSGAPHQKEVSIAGGALMIVFGIMMLVRSF